MKDLTYGDIFKMFYDTLKNSKPEDYRPICKELFTPPTTTNGITVWMEDGSFILYWPNLKKGE